MNNKLRNRLLLFLLVGLVIIVGQFFLPGTDVRDLKGQVFVSDPVSISAAIQQDTAKESEQKKLELLAIVGSFNDSEDIRKLRDFFKVYRQISEKYVDKKSPVEILDLAMVGMVEGLDPYSHLFINDRAEEVSRDLMEEDSYIGVGMTLVSYHKRTQVSEIIDDSPAQKAGIQPGDTVSRVDGKDIYGLNVLEVAKLIKGTEGTTVVIEIMSPRLQKPQELSIVRRQVVSESIVYRSLGNGIGYAKIKSFSPDEDVVARFRKALNASASKKLIIDLRGNPGGSLNAVNRMVGFIAGPGRLLVTLKKRGGREEEVITPGEGKRPKLPSQIVILTNNYSASASEIMAGTLKFYKKATIVGVRTYGKATAQNYYGLDTPNGRLENSRLILGLTMGRYYLPDGTNITGSGVQPDIEVFQPDDFRAYDILTVKDAQFQAVMDFLK